MASRTDTTFQKRLKELRRQEKQRDTAAKRMQRKLEKRAPETVNEPDHASDGEGRDISNPPSSDPA